MGLVEGISGGWLSELGRRIEGFGIGGGRKEGVHISTTPSLERTIYCVSPILNRIMDGRIPILTSVFVSLSTV
jgi:hypothetical protein